MMTIPPTFKYTFFFFPPIPSLPSFSVCALADGVEKVSFLCKKITNHPWGEKVEWGYEKFGM
jgi:hypothetical protein